MNLKDLKKIDELQKEYDLFQEKHTASDISFYAMLNGIEKYGKEEKERTEMAITELKKSCFR